MQISLLDPIWLYGSTEHDESSYFVSALRGLCLILVHQLSFYFPFFQFGSKNKNLKFHLWKKDFSDTSQCEEEISSTKCKLVFLKQTWKTTT